jgi:hypothetical protein
VEAALTQPSRPAVSTAVLPHRGFVPSASMPPCAASEGLCATRLATWLPTRSVNTGKPPKNLLFPAFFSRSSLNQHSQTTLHFLRA